MISWDKKRSYAVLIGCCTYSDEENNYNIPSVSNNINKFSDVLLNDNIIGLPRENISSISKKVSNVSILTNTQKFATKCQDTLLVYYAGHGLIDMDSEDLYLATYETDFSSPELSAIPMRTIRKILEGSVSKTKILILDCCFSGRGIRGVLSNESTLIQNELERSGIYAIASTASNQIALAPPENDLTLFTESLIYTMENGCDNNQKCLTLEDVFLNTRARLGDLKTKYPKAPLANRVTNIPLLEKFNFCLNVAKEEKMGDEIEGISAKIEKLQDTVSEMSVALGKIKPGHSHSGFIDNAKVRSLPIIMELIERLKRNQRSAIVLGISLESSWGIIRSWIAKYEDQIPFEIKLYCIDPKFAESHKELVNEIHLDRVKNNIKDIMKLTNQDHIKEKNINLELILYRSLTTIHGLSLGDGSLFVAPWFWEIDDDGSLTYPSFYEHIHPKDDSNRSKRYNELFDFWVDHLEKNGKKFTLISSN